MTNSRFRNDKLPPKDQVGQPSALNEQTGSEGGAGNLQRPENLPNQPEALTPSERQERDRRAARESS